MPQELAAVCALVFVATLVLIFGVLRDGRPPRPNMSDRERVVLWLYERLFMAILLGAMVVALLIVVPYLIVTQVF